MTKRFFSLILAAMLSLMLLIPAVTAEDQTIDTTAGHYYVYTENGKSLNVRFTPGGEKIGSLKYGARVYCYYLDTGNGHTVTEHTHAMFPTATCRRASLRPSRILPHLPLPLLPPPRIPWRT